ncbi:MAG: 1-deoxy-D-xylulose-5-phosphate synthase [Candidatus Cloacimonetes bacterium]|nr:1-deoxy-D-xylulose-5-phosphate synthase [Candidatus Cloacimonadota bacterium]MCF7813962.1 1-deoxy-D-xylulose-5-phosphate synthase [Candidatus Cloacimonadota bacterium]MCF7868806.1 1-deoxy-D-xylulose-5-phosphate synthase [Candidatus Cloacimonadota bacterium]MCF7884065.1 1-deoxy-D-xylulose-5-phosphate synthase [Candidatus Cloacimonadota bacterium]
MLEKIKKPTDVQQLSLAELQELAKDIRKRIIEVTAKNGGHVAPSLGATDLTVALLKVFDPKNDKMVWDVGHQSYAYKILTERNDRFNTLRQLNGISGFNNIFESEYDAFGVGHASTSISATLGITVAREKRQEKGYNIAIIGDGALTGGMSFEALNHAGHLQKDMIVILNDNNMSISKNVGALQAYLTNILVSRSYNAFKNAIWDFVHLMPSRIRRRMILSARKIEENLINSLAPNIIFEDLGFKYVGPIDGHNVPRMVRIFKKVIRNMNGPIFIHIVTKKGKGYDHAEDDASRFHGLGPYEIESGKCKGKNGTSYSLVLGNSLCEIAEKNKNVIAITAAMTDGTGLSKFAEKHPERFFDVGIAEQHAVTFAGGLATQGFKPFVAIYSTFLQRALDQVIHDIALQKLPVVFCLDRAGLVGEDGATHHGAFDLSYLNIIPNLAIMAPSDADEFEAMLLFAANYYDGPIAIRYPRGSARKCQIDHKPIEIGKFEMRQKGGKIAVIGIGKSFIDAEMIVDKMKIDFPEIKPCLVNARWMKPLDEKFLSELEENFDIVFTIEENCLKGGFGEAIKSRLVNARAQIYSFGLPDEFVTYGKTDELKNLIGLSTDQIYEKIKNILQN